MHTVSSTIYRSERIPSHTRQVRAALLVLIHLRNRYGALVDRHETRIRAALGNLERSVTPLAPAPQPWRSNPWRRA